MSLKTMAYGALKRSFKSRKAKILVHTQPAITCQPIKVESCSNPL